MEGVTVMAGVSSKGSMTDASGKFSIQVADNGVLVFSMTGYTSKTVSVKGRTTVTVMLEPE